MLFSHEKAYPIKINSDAYPDILLYNESTNKVTSTLNNTNTSVGLSFSASNNIAYSFAINSGQNLLGVCKIGIDAFEDLVVVNGTQISVYNNVSGAGYAAAVTLLTLPSNTSNDIIKVEDIDNNGTEDVLHYNTASGNCTVFFNGSNVATQIITNNAIGVNSKLFFENIAGTNEKEILINDGGNWKVFTGNTNAYSLFVNTDLYNALNSANANNLNIAFGDFKTGTSTKKQLCIISSTGFKVYDENTTTPFIGVVWGSGSILQNDKYKLVVGDFSGDAKIDILALVNSPDGNTLDRYYGDGFLLQNNSKSGFKVEGWLNHIHNEQAYVGNSNLDISQDAFWEYTSVDFNLDTHPDLLATNSVGNHIKIGLNAPEFEGYCWPLSAEPTENIDFHLSGFGKDILPNGKTYVSIVKLESSIVIPYFTEQLMLNNIQVQTIKKHIANDAYDKGCNWESSYTLQIPTTWESGFYAMILESFTGEKWYITFIVSGNQSTVCDKKKIALIANVNTWQAYNGWQGVINEKSGAGNTSFYGLGNNHSDFSFDRPCITSFPGANNMSFLQGELNVYGWLINNGYKPVVYTDIDLHNNKNDLIRKNEFLMITTHPEYWTGDMYNNAKLFQSVGLDVNGGNLICIGGNAVFEVVGYNFTNFNHQIQFYPAPVPADAVSATGIDKRRYYTFQNYKFGGTTIKYPKSLFGTYSSDINNSGAYSTFSIVPSATNHFLLNGVSSIFGNLSLNTNYYPYASGHELDRHLGYTNSANWLLSGLQ